MAASRYRSLLQLIQQWPAKTYKGDRDLGALIKKQILTKFPSGEASVVDKKECDKFYNSLLKISHDVHKNRWQRIKLTNASGASEDDLRSVLYSKEEKDKRLFDKLKESLFTKK